MEDETFELIKNRDVMKPEDAESLAKLIVDLWDTNYGKATYEDGILHLITGGWSENEEIVTALHLNKIFWIGYWVAEVRGGAYWFEIRRDWSRTPTIIWKR